MRSLPLLLLCVLPACAGRFRPLFDGKSLAGWKVVTGSPTAWKADQGVLSGYHAGAEAYDHLVFDSLYADFTLRFSFLWVRGNSGCFFRGEQVGSSGMSGHQVLTTGDQDAGGFWETHGRNWIIAPTDRLRSFYRPGAWNRWVVRAYGRRITLHLNDSLVGDLPSDPGRTRGYFALKLHGGGAVSEVRFKDIEAADTTRRGCTDSTSPAFDPYAFRDDGSCRPSSLGPRSGSAPAAAVRPLRAGRYSLDGRLVARKTLPERRPRGE